MNEPPQEDLDFVDSGPSRAEEMEIRLENRILRLERENWWLREQWSVSQEDCRRWRKMYDEAIRRVAIFYPYLAEITEDEAFRHWGMEVTK